MSNSVYKGAIPAGAISTIFYSDYSNKDSDILMMSFADRNGGNQKAAHGVTSPGGSVTASLQIDLDGLLEVWVVIGTETDTGRLTVSTNGRGIDNEAIEGSVRWVYSVEV